MSRKYSIVKHTTKTELPTVKVDDFFLHSKYNPENEASNFADKNYSENYVHVLFGNGLGYFSKALIERFSPQDKLIVIDPLLEEINCEIIENIIYLTDINENSIEREIIKVLPSYNVNLKMICSPNYDRLFEKEYKLVLNTIKNILRINVLFRNTVNFFAETWQENYIRNLLNVCKDSSLSDLEKYFNIPIVIASGGPSLTKQVKQLKEIRNRVILIAAGSTINTLLYHKIEPDFIVSIDGSEKNYDHFKGNIFEKSYFIYSVQNHYKIRRQFRNQGFSFIPSIDLDMKKHIEKTTGKELPMLVGGSSVANYALSIALFISTNKIALIGQDLAFTDNKTHAEHNKNFQSICVDSKENKGAFYTTGYYDEDVLTDSSFLSMKKSFEKIVTLSGEGERIYNCTEGGVKINDIKQKTFKDFCDEINNPNVKITVNESEENGGVVNLKKKIVNEIQNYDKLVEYLNNALKYLEKDNVSTTTFSLETIKGLNKIDKEIKKIFKKVSMNSIVEPITLDTLNYFKPKKSETKEEEYRRVYKQSEQLYSRLLHASKLSRTYSEDLLKEIDV